jgi:glycosyltransferase involved in cell wall biosynthesis
MSSSPQSVLDLTIVMPCLNEAETIGPCVRKAMAYLSQSGLNGEVVIGDNGSTDGSQSIAEREGARVINIPLRGYGAALYGACSAARGRWIIMGDSDDSYDFSRLGPFVDKLRDGYDLVMGNRFAGGIAPGAMPWKNRYIGNPALSGVGKLLFHCPVRDFHCGIRAFTKDAFLRMDLRTTGMEFASEIVIKAKLLGMRITEVPTTLSVAGRTRPPHLRPYRDGWRHLRFMLLFSPRWLFFYPGLLLMAAGLALGIALLSGPVHIGRAELSVDTLIYCAFAVTIGFQSALFSFLSRVYAVQAGLYPRSARFASLFDFFTLERGLLAGLVLTLGGFALAIYAIIVWKQQAFGQLDFNRMVRIVAPSATAMTLGVETLLFSFFFSTLGLSVNAYQQSASWLPPSSPPHASPSESTPTKSPAARS